MKIKNILLIMCTLIFISCTSTQNKKVLDQDHKENVENNVTFSNTNDPWKPFNRRMYYFNSKLDRYFLIPVSNGYKTVTPDPVEKGVHNFFQNLGEVGTFSNSLLQGNANNSLVSLNRFIINSTFGVLGLFDVATKLGLENEKQDFGLTLAHYGVTPGPYLVLPIFGPSSLRDASGLGVDTIINGTADPLKLADTKQSDPYILGLKTVDKRSNIKFRYHETGSPFEYEYVRYLYFKYRELQENQK